MRNRIYSITESIRKRVHTKERRGFEVFEIVLELYSGDDVVSSCSTDLEHLTTSLKREYARFPDSDRVVSQVIDTADECILEMSHKLEVKTPDQQELSGVGTPSQPTDLGALVEQKVQQIRQTEELERLRSEQADLKAKNEQLQGQVETLETQVEAKSNLEYYSKVAGDLLPGIAKALEKTSLGPALSGLAGEQTEKDDQTTVLESAKALIETCGEEQLSAFYMLVLELQSNPDLIPVIYQNAFSNETAH
ncbi:MAG: hypothetical protein DWQ21_07280 [Bacteroidetes bacterium]|nr:MAG: hypothetical protein DWQ21_07280 [Bacteroidota bacterium]REK64301.1 MAG: hypothetical protein DWQ49_01785 [Bacteroidota bacterium]